MQRMSVTFAEYLLFPVRMKSSMTGVRCRLPYMTRISVITVRVYGMTSIPKSKPSWRMAPMTLMVLTPIGQCAGREGLHGSPLIRVELESA